jgi:hypothetical protein
VGKGSGLTAAWSDGVCSLTQAPVPASPREEGYAWPLTDGLMDLRFATLHVTGSARRNEVRPFCVVWVMVPQAAIARLT